MDRRNARRRRGMTLAELVIVMSVLAVLSALVIPNLAGMIGDSKQTITASSMAQLRAAVLDHYAADHAGRLPLPVDSSRLVHPQLVYLYVNGGRYQAAAPAAGLGVVTFDPVTATGWRGPYVQSGMQAGRYQVDSMRNFTTRYGLTGDLAPLDAWGSPIVLQQPTGAAATDFRFARLVSAGVDGILNTPPDALSVGPANQGDDLVLPLGVMP